ncbi:hypothetical protein Taro_028518, partial [Colocasia esculenta]|nr:hypothetical protein [Colocasia esculenta]
MSETQASSASGLNERLKWDQTRLTYLTKLLVDHHRAGKRASTSWKPEAWETMRTEFNNRFTLNASVKQLKARVQMMKNDYVVIKNILNASGFGFNPMLNTFVATDEVWDAYIQKHPEARTWRGVTIPLYNEWYEIFEGTKAYGSRQHNTLPRTETIEHGDPYMTPPHQTPVDLTKDDDSAASSLDFKVMENKKGKQSISPNEKKKRRRSKEPSSSFVEAMGEQCGPDMPAHLHCWLTVWNRGGGRRRDLNASALPDAIQRTVSVTHGVGFVWRRVERTHLKGLNVASALDTILIRVLSASFRPDRAEEALSSAGEELLWLLWRFPMDFDSGWLVRHGNHTRMMLGAWACRRRGGFDVLRLLLAGRETSYLSLL